MKVCTKCGVNKEESEFWFNKKTGFSIARCNECESKSKAAYREANKERLNKVNLEWQRNNRDKTKAAQDRWKEKNPGLARERANVWYVANKVKAREQQAKKRAKDKDAAFQAYGGYECKCCGESIPAFLTIDHIDENGSEHRKTDKGAFKLYVWLRLNGYPGGFQVLCMNCNWAKSKNNGICPHKTFEGSTTSRKAYTQAGGNAKPLN